MNLRQLRQRCERRLQSLDLPMRFDLETLQATLAARRGRPIVLQPFPHVPRAAGFCLGSRNTDVIIYEQDTSPLHQRHIIAHELSHLLWEHRPTAVSEAEVGQLLLPEADPALVQHLFRRADYSQVEEAEAELLASLILERMRSDQTSAPAPERLEAVLEEGARHPA